MFKRGTYWAGTGTYQAEFKRLRTALVPVGGVAATGHGELLRAIGSLYYDLKHHGLAHIEARWDDWHLLYAHRDLLTAAIGHNGAWVFAVVDRAITERYLTAKYGGGDDDAAPRPFPDDCFERLVDGCVLAVQRLDRAAA